MTAEQLADIEAIKRLKARYFRFMDTKAWDEWRTLFTDDCRYEGTSRAYDGPDAFVAGTRERLQDAVTIHQGHMPEIELIDATSARGIWALFDHVEFAEMQDTGRGVSRGFTGHGHYEEEYRKEDGVWRIALLRLTRLRLTAIVGAPDPVLDGPAILSSVGRQWLTPSPPR